jgi:hypothetical protein
MATDTLTTSSSQDIPELFRMLDIEIGSRVEHVQRLKKTLETFQRAPDLFDTSNLAMVEAVCREREEEVVRLCRDVEAAKKLYTATVQGLKEQIGHKASILQRVDHDLGTISREPKLREHFAMEQANLTTGIARAEQVLVQTICDKLGPTLFSSGGLTATASR